MRFKDLQNQTVWRSLSGFFLAAALIGCLAGLAGIALSYLLHGVQHLAFAYRDSQLTGHESFLQGVAAASPERRFSVLLLCGLLAGTGWWAIYHFGQPLISIKNALTSHLPAMPLASTCAHILLQILTVGLGSPLGREVAPREAGALIGGRFSALLGLSARQQRILIACGAGAGLAAVYNVPLSGALFTLEVLLLSFSWRSAAAAMISSLCASLTARIGLGNEHQYLVENVAVSASLECWAILCGPLFGLAAWYYSELAGRARAAAPRNWKLIPATLLNFSLLGFMVIWFPQLPGNGKGAVSLCFDSQIGIGLAASLLCLKVIFTLSSLRSGAQGGLLTPGLANGALLAIMIGSAWNLVWQGSSPGSFALVGSTAFLAVSQQMPLTAMILVLELTRVSPDFIVPMLSAIGGAVLTASALRRQPDLPG